MKMKCYKIPCPGEIVLTEEDIPTVDDGEVLLFTRRVSTCSTDVHYFDGTLVPPQWPVIPGHEYFGEVVESRNKSVKVGDKIAYWGQTDFGGFAEYRKIKPVFPDSEPETFFTERGFCDSTGAAILACDEEPPEEITMIEPLVSVLRSITFDPPRPGANILVVGAGPCGLIATQLFKRLYSANKVTVLEKNPGRAALAKQAGADCFLDIGKLAEIDDVIKRTNGAYVNYVFDTLGDITADIDIFNANTRSYAMQLLQPKGKYSLYGATQIPQQIDMWAILSKGLQLRASAFDVRAIPMEITACIFRSAWHIMSSGLLDLTLVISKVVDFYDEKEIVSAFKNYGVDNHLKTLAQITPSRKPQVKSTDASDAADKYVFA